MDGWMETTFFRDGEAPLLSTGQNKMQPWRMKAPSNMARNSNSHPILHSLVSLCG